MKHGLLIYRPRMDGRLSLPGWLTHSGHFTYEVVTCQLLIRESAPAKDLHPND